MAEECSSHCSSSCSVIAPQLRACSAHDSRECNQQDSQSYQGKKPERTTLGPASAEEVITNLEQDFGVFGSLVSQKTLCAQQIHGENGSVMAACAVGCAEHPVPIRGDEHGPTVPELLCKSFQNISSRRTHG